MGPCGPGGTAPLVGAEVGVGGLVLREEPEQAGAELLVGTAGK